MVFGERRLCVPLFLSLFAFSFSFFPRCCHPTCQDGLLSVADPLRICDLVRDKFPFPLFSRSVMTSPQFPLSCELEASLLFPEAAIFSFVRSTSDRERVPFLCPLTPPPPAASRSSSSNPTVSLARLGASPSFFKVGAAGAPTE